MISKIPGWLNFLLLAAFYYVLLSLLRYYTGAQCDRWFLVMVCLFYSGGYLAKWRWQGGGWRFY